MMLDGCSQDLLTKLAKKKNEPLDKTNQLLAYENTVKDSNGL